MAPPSRSYPQAAHLRVHVNITQSNAFFPLLVNHLANRVDRRRLAQLLQIASTISIRDLCQLLDAVPLSQRRIPQDEAKNCRPLLLRLSLIPASISHRQIYQKGAR